MVAQAKEWHVSKPLVTAPFVGTLTLTTAHVISNGVVTYGPRIQTLPLSSGVVTAF